MRDNQLNPIPQSFAETAQIVERYVHQEILEETQKKQLHYHNIYHALAVKRRAETIFHAVRPVLCQSILPLEVARLETLTSLCGLAHDMVQLFEAKISVNQSRKRHNGKSERGTVTRLIQLINQLNAQLVEHHNFNQAHLFSERDLKIIQDAILATICDGEVIIKPSGESIYSIYQPYLYDPSPKISIIGSIIALADLGTLGIDGVDEFIRDGVLIFLEDNPDLFELLDPSNQVPNSLINKMTVAEQNLIHERLSMMTKFMVNLARERKSRLSQEIAGLNPAIRQILREQVFVYLDQDNINQIEHLIPTSQDVELSKLIKFFRINF